MANKISVLERNYSNLNKRLAELMQANGITIQILANKAGIAVGTIQKLLSDPACNPTIGSIEAICNVFGISISELIGQEERLNSSNLSTVFLVNWEELPIVLSNTQNLTCGGIKSRERIKTSCPVSKNSFALKVHDNSMLPLFPEKSILIFDPQKPPMDNNYIILKLHNYQAVVFKQLHVDEPFKYITSVNPLFKDNPIKLRADDKIIAVLVQSQIHY